MIKFSDQLSQIIDI